MTVEMDVSDNSMFELDNFEQLVLDTDLDRLEALTSSFNIFEAIGAVRYELRHSDFLAFLLNPSESHGLNRRFTKALLFDVVKNNKPHSKMSAIDIDLYDFDQLEIRREWENIDILILSEKEQFVCAIENKIDSKEHSSQLARYQEIVQNHFKNFHTLFIYLTINGDPPETDDDWLIYSYKHIFDTIRNLLVESERNIGDEVSTLMKHYMEMLNRHLMTENEIAELSRKIYQRHKKALDIIFEHKPDMLSETNSHMTSKLESYQDFSIELDHCTKGYIRFAVPLWDTVDGQKSGGGRWTSSGRVLLFEIQNSMNEISIKLIIGPGERDFRERVFDLTGEAKIFRGRSKKLYESWTQIFKKRLVSKEKMTYDLDPVKNLIDQELEQFFYHGDFEKIVTEMNKILAI